MFKYKIYPEKTDIPNKSSERKQSTSATKNQDIILNSLQTINASHTDINPDFCNILNSMEKWNIDEFLEFQMKEKIAFDVNFKFIIPPSIKKKFSSNFWTSLTGCNYLHFACLFRATRIAKELLRKDGNLQLNYQCVEGITALHISSALGDFYTASLLISYGSNPNITDKRGRNCIHYAAIKNIETCLILCKYENLDIHSKDENDKSPTQYAESSNLKDISALLQSLTKKNEKYWIPINIMQLECQAITSRKDSEHQCFCGRLLIDHTMIFENYDVGPLDQVEIGTSYFGEIEFSSRYESSPYIRLSHLTPMETTSKLLLEKWSMTKPSLLITIYGNGFNGHAINEILKKGIWKSASNQDTIIWIITNGISNNLTEVVSEAVREFADAYGANQMSAVALFPWRCHEDTGFLYTNDYAGNQPTVYYEDTTKHFDKDALEKKHTHYIFIDYSYEEDIRTYLNYRILFENSISKIENLNDIDNEDNVSIPLCAILINGSRNDLYLLHESIIKNKKPAVIIKGSGGLANLIGYIFDEISDNNRKKKSLQEVLNKDRLQNVLSEIWDITADFETEIHMIKNIIENRHLLEIFSVEDDSINDLDKKIISSLLSQERSSLERYDFLDISQLKIAISINRCDIAQEKIFTEGKKWNDTDLDPIVRKTICENKVPFVKLFIDKGFDIERIITINLLEYLYITDIFGLNPEIDLLRRTLKFVGFKKNRGLFTLRDIGHAIKHLMGENFSPLYLSDSFQFNASSAGVITRPIRELFLWTLLTKRMDLAQILWSLEKETLAAVLFAANICRSMAKYTDTLAEKDNLGLFADVFESKAVGLIDECYNENPTNTKKNLIRELQYYGNYTCMELASEGNSIKFIGHKSCQELLDQIWKYSLDDSTHALKFINYLLFGMVFPLLIPFYVQYKHNFYSCENKKEEFNSEKSQEKSTNASQMDLKDVSDITHVSFDEFRCNSTNLKIYIKKIFDFYSTPVIKFSYATIFYIVYLLYFTTMLLTRLQVTSIRTDIPFIILIIWTSTLAFEELRQAFSSGISFKSYLSNVWNKLDVLAHFFFIIGTICYIFSQLDLIASILMFSLFDLRPIGALRETILRLSRFNFGISIFFFIFRIMQLFSINSNLGPKIVMIQIMIEKDLGPFIAILFVFVISYAVILWTVAFSIEDSRTFNDLPPIIFEMFRTSYFQILGDLRLDVLTANSSCQEHSFMCDDPWGRWLSPLILAVYLVLSTVLLISLLVAMFTNTYERIESSSNQYWTLQRYQLMQEYSNRPSIPPPFVLIWQAYYLISRCNIMTANPFRNSYKNQTAKEKQLIQWERMRALDYLRSLDPNYSQKSQSKIIVLNHGNSTVGAMGNIKRDLDSMKDQINETLSERLCYLENRLLRLDSIEINLENVTSLIKQLKLTYKKKITKRNNQEILEMQL